MHGHAYAHYVDYPQTIFRGWNAGLMMDNIYTAALSAKNSGRPLDEQTAKRAAWYPTLVSDLLTDGVLSPVDAERCLLTPALRFRALTNHYAQMAPHLEAGIVNDEESVERLVRWSLCRDKALSRPHADYLVQIKDPNRLYRLTPPDKRPPREKVMQLSEVHLNESPEWAFMYVSTHPIQTLSAELIRTLAKSEEYSYLTAYVLSRRGLMPRVWQGLVHSLKSYRWIYHALTDLAPGGTGGRLDQEIEVSLINQIHKSPPWAVQMWESRRWSGEQLAWAYEECLASAPQHECLPELNSWIRMQRAIAGVPLPAA